MERQEMKKYILSLLLFAGMGGMVISPVHAGGDEEEKEASALGNAVKLPVAQPLLNNSNKADDNGKPGYAQLWATRAVGLMGKLPGTDKPVNWYNRQLQPEYKGGVTEGGTVVLKQNVNSGDLEGLKYLVVPGQNKKLGVREQGGKQLVFELTEEEGQDNVVVSAVKPYRQSDEDAQGVVAHGTILYPNSDDILCSREHHVLVVAKDGQPLRNNGRLVFTDASFTAQKGIDGCVIDDLVNRKSQDAQFPCKFYNEAGQEIVDLTIDKVKKQCPTIADKLRPTAAVYGALGITTLVGGLLYKAITAGYNKLFGDDEDDDNDDMDGEEDEEEKLVPPVKQQPVQQIKPVVTPKQPEAQQVAPVAKPVEKPAQHVQQQPVVVAQPAVVAPAQPAPVATATRAVPQQHVQQQAYPTYPARRASVQQAQMNRFGVNPQTPVRRYGVSTMPAPMAPAPMARGAAPMYYQRAR